MQLETEVSRRLILGLAVAGPATAVAQIASMPADMGGAKPYKVLRNAIGMDKRRVREFMAYACPACQRYHAGIAQWARTMPASLSFNVTPVILNASSQAEITLVSARVAVSKIAPASLARFDVDALELMQSRANSPNQGDIEALVARHADTARALALMRQRQTLVQIEEWLDSAGRYEVVKTPTVGVLGQYTVTPEDAAARPELFFGLINGLISQTIKA